MKRDEEVAPAGQVGNTLIFAVSQNQYRFVLFGLVYDSNCLVSQQQL